MRLIGILKTEKQAQQFSAFLRGEKIEHSCETLTDTGGQATGCQVWILNEDQIDTAKRWLEQFEANPDDPRFLIRYAQSQPHEDNDELNSPISEWQPSTKSEKSRDQAQDRQDDLLFSLPETAASPSLIFPLTLSKVLALICIALFALQSFFDTPIAPNSKISFAKLIDKHLLFDIPFPVEAQYQLLTQTGNLDLQQKISEAPFWRGLYLEYLAQRPLGHFSWPAVPMFEKISSGEWWRVITPSLLHFNIFTLFFNLFWILLYGSAVEARIGTKRYLVLLVLLAMICNVVQYLITGYYFKELAGVVYGLIAFAWMQQRLGTAFYRLPDLLFFLMIISTLVYLSFNLPAIANSQFNSASHLVYLSSYIAEITGAIIGLALARLDFFQKHS